MKGKNERRGPLGKVEQNRFAAALDALRVTKGREGDAFVAAIDLSPVVEVLGAGVGEKGRIEFRLTPDQEVIISHPPTESRGNGSPTRTDAEAYPWKGELPARQPYAPPKTGRRETPISALLCLAAYRGGLWPELRSRTHAAATRLWREVWREIAEAMNQRALAHANRFGLDWERYRLLCRRPLAEISPRAAVEFLKEEGFDLRAGWRVEDLTPLFRAGGEITIEGALLVSELKQKLERGHTGNEPTRTPTPTRRDSRR